MGLWLYAVPAAVAASLAIVCSCISQLQTLHLIWRDIRWRRLLIFVLPGVIGVPIGTLILPHIEPRLFKLGIGLFLVVYSSYVLDAQDARKQTIGAAVPPTARSALAAASLAVSPVFPACCRLSGPTSAAGPKWNGAPSCKVSTSQYCGWPWSSHAASGLLTREVLLDAACRTAGHGRRRLAWRLFYRRLGDHGYQRIVMLLLFISGAGLIWTSR